MENIRLNASEKLVFDKEVTPSAASAFTSRFVSFSSALLFLLAIFAVSFASPSLAGNCLIMGGQKYCIAGQNSLPDDYTPPTPTTAQTNLASTLPGGGNSTFSLSDFWNNALNTVGTLAAGAITSITNTVTNLVTTATNVVAQVTSAFNSGVASLLSGSLWNDLPNSISTLFGGGNFANTVSTGLAGVIGGQIGGSTGAGVKKGLLAILPDVLAGNFGGAFGTIMTGFNTVTGAVQNAGVLGSALGEVVTDQLSTFLQSGSITTGIANVISGNLGTFLPSGIASLVYGSLPGSVTSVISGSTFNAVWDVLQNGTSSQSFIDMTTSAVSAYNNGMAQLGGIIDTYNAYMDAFNTMSTSFR